MTTQIVDKQIIEEPGKGITQNSLIFFRENKDRLGTILAIHIRNEPNGDYQTCIEGERADMILWGLSFGYGGEGPKGLATIVEESGVKDRKYWDYIFNSSEAKSISFAYENAEAKVGTRLDEGFLRSSIQLQHKSGGGTTSLDVVAPNGELVCRINIASHSEDAKWCNVDICYGLAYRQGKALAWNQGKEVLRYEADGSSLIAVELTKE